MSRAPSGLACLLMALGCLATVPLASAQEAAKVNPPSGFRRLARGVETTIAPKLEASDTFSRHDFSAMLLQLPAEDWTPATQPPQTTLRAMSTNTIFRNDVWYLEFSFKPLRTITVDLPNPTTGKLESKVIWYMVYRVKNLGKHMKPVDTENPDQTISSTIENVDHDILWFPQFSLESQQLKLKYSDTLVPLAIDAIRKREDPKRTFLNCVEMSTKAVKVSTDAEDNSVWGIATWQDVDLRIDYFSIFVRGLTNAYKWQDPPLKDLKKGDSPGTDRRFAFKDLELHFWRPGDEFHPDDQGIFYGIPGQVDFRWIYR